MRMRQIIGFAKGGEYILTLIKPPRKRAVRNKKRTKKGDRPWLVRTAIMP